ncbi:MAG: hypothetical protein FWG74_06950, partial [Planctomycetes bacterium]|nr:hypothetical protein [Planctomycetota bacterium]
MLAAKNEIRKVVVIRSGGLGDVLVIRGVIRFIKDAFPGVELNLVAPGERGALLCRPNWADRCFDWECSAFSWLFSDGSDSPPPTLRAVFSDCDLVLAYVSSEAGAGGEQLEISLEAVAPLADKLFCPPYPEAGCGEWLGEWLVRTTWDFCRWRRFLSPETAVDFAAAAAARLRIDAAEDLPGVAGAYVV